jgi:hypothetical protein
MTGDKTTYHDENISIAPGGVLHDASHLWKVSFVAGS